MINANFEHPIIDTSKKDVTNVQLPDHDSDFSNDEISVTMPGVVIQWQPRVENIKEVCLKTPHDYNITTAIYDIFEAPYFLCMTSFLLSL